MLLTMNTVDEGFHFGSHERSAGYVAQPAVATDYTEQYDDLFGGNPAFYRSTINETTNATHIQYNTQENTSSDWVDDTLFIGAATVVDPQSHFSGINVQSMGQVLPQYPDINLPIVNDFDQTGDELWNMIHGIFEDGQATHLPSDHCQHSIEAAFSGVHALTCDASGVSHAYTPSALPEATTIPIPHNAVATSSTQLLPVETAPKKSLKRARESECPTPMSTSEHSHSSKSGPSLSCADDAESCGTKARPAKRARRGRSSITSVPKRIKCVDPDCDYSSDTRGDLKRHMLSLRHKNPSFYCQIAGCKKVFTRDDALKRHMKTIPHPVKLVESEESAPGKEPEAKPSPRQGENSN